MKSIDMTDVGPYFVGLWVLIYGFIIVFQPVWCIIDCALDKERSKSSTILWVVALFFATCFAGLFYGLFITRSQRLRAASWGSILGFIISVVSFIGVASQRPETTIKNPKTTKSAHPKKPTKPKVKNKPKAKKSLSS